MAVQGCFFEKFFVILRKTLIMATPTHSVQEYIWLINIIHRMRGITFAEISTRWENTSYSNGRTFSRTTFNRHRDAIMDIFGINIACDRRTNGYYIENDEVFNAHSVQNWMISTLSVNNIISQSFGIQDRILLENIPSGGTFLELIIKAMKNSRMISAEYRRYGSDVCTKFLMMPYCVKLFRQRWYVLCRHRNGRMGVFSLDRFAHLEVSEQKFVIDPDFNAAEYFSECFGIVSEVNAPAERIVIRAFGSERFALRDLPLHHNQREIFEGEDYSDFEITMRPTFDFSAHLLSRGIMAMVIEPQWLADEIRDMHREAAEMYG